MTLDPRLMLEVREAFAYYEGMMAGLPKLMVGKLMLTKKYIAFHQYEVEKVGLLERPRLKQTTNTVSIPLDRIISVSVEQGVRATKSRPNWKNPDDFMRKSSGERQINVKPRLLNSSERYSRLVLTVESEYGVEMAYFELDEPTKWASIIASRIKKGVT
jgi:hypothetical protein